MNESFEALTPYLEKKRRLHYLICLLNYDIATACPEDSIEDLSDIFGSIDVEAASILQDPEYIALIKNAAKDPNLNDLERRLVEHELESIEFMEKVKPEQLALWNKHASKSGEIWRKAKAKGDFSMWLPHLKNVVEDAREKAKIRQKEGQTLYDACLSFYEPDCNEAFLDSIFDPLKEYLLKKIPEVLSKKKTIEMPNLAYPKVKQEALSYRLLNLIGYNLKKGALRESEHPFSDNLSRNDARITTNYDLNDFRSSMFSVLHEGGHALEFQHWPKEQYESYVEGFASMATCETHSRFFENILGRSKALMPMYRKILSETLDPSFESLSDDELFALFNDVKLIANRCDSDELTYSLHIILRYEIEKDLINGKLNVEDIPARWNQLTKEYLGVEITNDRDGCMQDVHWTDGSFGYFPSYALGNLYGAMILERMKEDIDVDALLFKGDFKPILDWLSKHDFAYDYRKPNEWIQKITGKSLDPNAFVRYLEQKY